MRLFPVVCVGSAWLFASAMPSVAMELDDFALDAPFSLLEALPEVLTASRLKQPRAEVPASVTVIDAAQIEAWGVRTIPELLRFVPGMVIGNTSGDSGETMIYHASNPNLMRRMQVLVDGRSLYRSAIATVSWDDIPVALEDIQRIEVIRGPNSATYGANSFMAVVNIMTHHPEDTQGTRIRYRNGNNGINDSYVSYSGWQDSGAYRVTASWREDTGFDGKDAPSGKDELRDSKQHGFVNVRKQQRINDDVEIDWMGAVTHGSNEILMRDFYETPPDRDTDSAFVQMRLHWAKSAQHQTQLQAYWTGTRIRQEARVCSPTVLLDPNLFDLYLSNRPWAMALVDDPGVALDPAAIATYDLSHTDLLLTQRVLTYPGINPNQRTCGQSDANVDEQRFDIEWQDTVIWSPNLRTVSGLNVRRDAVKSETFFNGRVHNDSYRAFANMEWRMQPWLLLNVGGMYEQDRINDSVFSPRIALNALLTPQHSVRWVYSEAVRSPDMLEQEPNYTITAKGLTDNYLGLTEGTYFVSQPPDSRDLSHERIQSIELGYYGYFAALSLEVDAKVYRDALSDLISEQINLNTYEINSTHKMDINGAEIEVQWQPALRHHLWLAVAYVDAQFRIGDARALTVNQQRNLPRFELRSAPDYSLASSWQYRGDDWFITAAHIWNERPDFDNTYRRYELHGRKQFQVATLRPWMGVFWQHLATNAPMTERGGDVYSKRNLYSVQLGLAF